MRVAIGCGGIAFEPKGMQWQPAFGPGHEVHGRRVCESQPATYPDGAFAMLDELREREMRGKCDVADAVVMPKSDGESRSADPFDRSALHEGAAA